MPVPPKGFPSLRKGRCSSAGQNYFLTICAQRPCSSLHMGPFVHAAFEELRRLEVLKAWQTRCAVVMPDHVHLLISLGENADLSTTVRLLKGRLTPTLRKLPARWQPSFYDHRLRPGEDVLPVFLYIYLNPYRAGLCTTDQTWPGYLCDAEDWAWFGELTKTGCPEPEWLR